MSTQGLQFKPNRERLAAPQRRAAIIDAAIDLFATRGFQGTTTRELAAAVGVSEPVLYQHFATKRALYDAILQVRVEQSNTLDAELESARTAFDDRRLFTRLAELLLNWYVDDPRWVRLVTYASLEKHEFSQMFFERQVCMLYELLNPYLRHQMATGTMRTMNPVAVARTFAGMIAHHGLIFSLYAPGQLAASREEIVQTVVEIFLNGISTK